MSPNPRFETDAVQRCALHGAGSTRALDMAIDRATAQRRAIETLACGPTYAVELEPVESLPGHVYGFDPSGWFLFAVHRRDELRVGGGEYLGVHSSTGEVRRLGIIGE